MIALAANVILLSAFARFTSTAATAGATAHDADTCEGGIWARIRMRNVGSEVRRDLGKSTGRYWE
jgi:hypothetical protein